MRGLRIVIPRDVLGTQRNIVHFPLFHIRGGGNAIDIAAIKNTNTKIVLRTPEANDRDAVGHSLGLTEDQVNEIAKLPAGVAVVYQNNWVSPILTLINKADVKEMPYKNMHKDLIKPLKQSRSELIRALMHPWLNGEGISNLARTLYVKA